MKTIKPSTKNINPYKNIVKAAYLFSASINCGKKLIKNIAVLEFNDEVKKSFKNSFLVVSFI
jgi:hypothetical protein